MKRIILHWTAGSNTPSPEDKEHYHFLIDGKGRVHNGKWPVSANAKISGDDYAAHTRGCNTGSIGVSLAAMAGAQDRPFSAGKHPITPEQVATLVTLCRKLCAEYSIPVSRETVLSHAEVQPTLGIAQRGKWDIAWLPGMDKPGDPVKVGDHIRGLISARVDATPLTRPVEHVKETPKPEHVKPKPAPVGGIVAAIVAVLAALAAWWGGL